MEVFPEVLDQLVVGEPVAHDQVHYLPADGIGVVALDPLDGGVEVLQALAHGNHASIHLTYDLSATGALGPVDADAEFPPGLAPVGQMARPAGEGPLPAARPTAYGAGPSLGDASFCFDKGFGTGRLRADGGHGTTPLAIQISLLELSSSCVSPIL